MQLGARPTTPPPAEDLAAALRGAAAAMGHRPAVTVRRPGRRDEQGFASLAQWAAKTAHWLEIEHQLAPGDRVDLVTPASWPAVALCLGAWWSGITVHVGPGDAEVAVAHVDADRSALTGEVVLTGDEVDGSPSDAFQHDHEAYAIAVQAFPDQPPAPRASPTSVAAVIDGEEHTHRALLDRARTWGGDGPVGLDAAVPASLWIAALAVRPLVTGAPTVLLDGTGREDARGERVGAWIG